MIISTSSLAKANLASTAGIQSLTIISPQDTAIYNTAITPFNLPLNIHIDVPKMGMVKCLNYSLDGGANITISGNTTIPVEYGDHNLKVYATDVSNETYASETVYFTITILCDANGDGKVDISDIIIIATAYGSTPNDPNWNPNADMAYPYEKIDIFDIVTAVSHYGETR